MRRHRRHQGNARSSQQSTQIPSLPDTSIAGVPTSKEMIAGATILAAVFYLASGVSQPLLMTAANLAGIADPRAQLYMLFYYAGPSMVGLGLRRRQDQHMVQGLDNQAKERYWPSYKAIVRACSVACLDILAQSINYAGNTLSGPTVFAIIYSSVTIWAALYSRILLGRELNVVQWVGMAIVFCGLSMTALHSINVGHSVFLGACLVLAGSSLHAMTYVISEKIMTVGDAADLISVRANCAVQGIVATIILALWQIAYTIPRFQELVAVPMAEAGSSYWDALLILGLIGAANLVHALSFFHTLAHFPGGAVSAGIMKGLQAVLVFFLTSLIFCGKSGGEEMCFTSLKFASLIVVVSGVLLYGLATEAKRRQVSISAIIGARGFKRIPNVDSGPECV